MKPATREREPYRTGISMRNGGSMAIGEITITSMAAPKVQVAQDRAELADRHHVAGHQRSVTDGAGQGRPEDRGGDGGERRAARPAADRLRGGDRRGNGSPDGSQRASSGR